MKLFKKTDSKEISSIIPIKYDRKFKVGKLPDGTIVDVVQIVCKDLNNLDEATNNIDILSWVKLYSTYIGDLKIVASFFPVDTSAQTRYFSSLLERTKNPIYREAIEEELYKCEAIHEQFLNKEFMLCFYSKNMVEYKENYIKIMSMNDRNTMFKEMSSDKKEKFFYLMANKNLNF